MSDADLEPGTPVTRIVFGPNGQNREVRHGFVIRKLKTRYLIKWTFPNGFEATTPHTRIEGTRGFY